MKSQFDPDSAVFQAIISILSQEPEGLSIPAIRRRLTQQGRPGVQESDIEDITRQGQFRRLPGGRIVLKENEPDYTPPLEEPGETWPEKPYWEFPSTLRDLPSLDVYIIFDVETNGLSPEFADFFQLSAIKVVNGHPVAAFDEYASIPTTSITQALRLKLHFDELGLEEKVAGASSQEIIAQKFLKFAGDLPLIAHNGMFDYQFLKKAAPEVPNKLIDSMELFLLAYPTLSSHSIESLAERFGYKANGNSWIDVLTLDTALGISRQLGVKPGELFHSAIFDCLILHLLLQRALAELRQLSDVVRIQFHNLSSGMEVLVGAATQSSEIPKHLSEVFPLRYWGSDAEALKMPLPVIPYQCNEKTVLSIYKQILSKANWSSRPAQSEMIQHITYSFSNGTNAMIEASTGTGKTLAYLLPALVQARSSGQQVVVSTSTKALQDQLVRDLENLIRPHLPFEFRFTMLKGQENYLCLSRLWSLYLEVFYGPGAETISFEEKLCMLFLIRFAQESQDGDLQSISYWFQNRFPILNYFRSQITSQRESCGKNCQYHAACFFPRARTLAAYSDLLIVNHSLLMLKHWDEDSKFNLVLDEAHNLEEVATNVLTEEVSQALIENLLRRLLEPGDRRGLLILARRGINDSTALNHALILIRSLRRSVRGLGGYLHEFLDKQGVRLHPKYGATWRMRAAPRRAQPFAWNYVQEPINRILTDLDALAKDIAIILNQLSIAGKSSETLIKELQIIYNRLFGTPEETGQRILLEDIPQVNFDPQSMVHWIGLEASGISDRSEITPDRIAWGFYRAPVRVADALNNLVYEKARTLVLTSATLTLGEGGFNFFRDRLGLARLVSDSNLIQLKKAFNYAENVMLGMPGYFKASARYEEMPRFQEELAQELSCLFRFTEGRGLVLHTARQRMEYVAQKLESELDNIPVYWQREGASTRLLREEFASREESVLLGLRSFWEGIDVPGPSLSYLVIEKLPFPVPTEPVTQARMEQINLAGGNEWMEYLIPLATLQFKQGFGRLMRKSDDRGVVLFMDKRLRGDAFYREAVLRSLPGFKRSEEMMEAEENRVEFYRSIGRHMASVPEFAQWNWDDRLDLFPCIREEVIPELEKILVALQLPLHISKEEYVNYRENLLQAATHLINGFAGFRQEQEDAMQAILTGQDALVVLPTGSGKSITFQLPALLRSGVTIVFSPLIALMRDQVDKFRDLGLSNIDYIVSGQSAAHRDDVYRRIARNEIRLVYVSPERIRDRALHEAIGQSTVIQIVVDEAHCVHMWGPSFRPDFLNIPDLFPENRPPLAAFTATATKETRAVIADALRLNKDSALITKSVDRPELKFIVYNNKSPVDRIVNKPDKMRVLVKILRAAQKNDEIALVYTSTVREAEYLTKVLNLQGFTVRHYHGQMTSQGREEVQEMFREGIIRIIVATKAFGMGIDKSDVRYVIHYDVPGDLESYYQESGRAGRDGKTSYCVMLYHHSDLSTQQYFIRKAFPDQEELTSLVQALHSHIGPDNRILISPNRLSDESGIEIERLDVALHLLERMNIVRRSFNFTLMANLLLNRSSAWLSTHLDERQGELLNKLVSACGVSENRGIQLDLLTVAQSIEADPIVLDRLLVELSGRGWAVYRPWDRGYILEPEQKLVNEEQIVLNRSEVQKLIRNMERKLRQMINYAESLGPGDCRREYVVRHFDENLEKRPSPCCDLCDSSMSLPWMNIPSEEVTDLPSTVNPEYIILQTVQWNERLAKDSKPYTEGTLAKILKGDSFGASAHIEDPIKRLRRVKRLEASPFFGVLQGLNGGENTIRRIMSTLLESGYLELTSITFKQGADDIEYKAPILSQEGWSQVNSGRYI